jgi:hypothetical protein
MPIVLLITGAQSEESNASLMHSSNPSLQRPTEAKSSALSDTGTERICDFRFFDGYFNHCVSSFYLSDDYLKMI